MQQFKFTWALLGLDDVVSAFESAPKSISELKSILGRKFGSNLANIYYILKLKYKENSIELPKIELAQTDKKISEFINQSNVSRLIKKCKEISLLYPVKNGEGKEGYKVGKQGKTYYVNKSLAKIILDFGDLNDFPKPELKTHYAELKTIKTKAETDAAQTAESIIDTDTPQTTANPVKDEDITLDYTLLDGLKLGHYKGKMAEELAKFTDEQLIVAVQTTYKQLDLIQSYNDKFNTDCQYPELLRTCRVKVKRGKDFIKLSCRDYSNICKFVNSEGEDKNTAINTRQEFFTAYFGKEKVAEYDLKSSIYRITSFINTGIWAESSHDFYADMCPEYATKYRKIVKKACMFVQFSDMSDKQIAHQLRQEFGDIKEKSEDMNLEGLDDFEKGFELLCSEIQTDVNLAIVNSVRANMQRAIGQNLGTEVFLHESAIMSMLYRYLIKKYGKAVCVYDAVFADCPQDELDDICNKFLQTASKFYFDKYIDVLR